MVFRHPAHAPSRGASRFSGCLPRSAKCPALYGLVKAGITHTSGRPSKGAEQSGTSCFKVPRSAAQRALDAGRASFHDVRVQRACLQTNPLRQGPCRMAPALPGIPHWEFFLVSFHLSLIIVHHTRIEMLQPGSVAPPLGEYALARLQCNAPNGDCFESNLAL